MNQYSFDKRTTIEKFWDNVKRGSTADCWEWTGRNNIRGYGRIYDRPTKKFIFAHRLSYKIHYGDFEKSLCVCHHCDNPSCVNPTHLFLGTPKDNAIDRERKGRNIPPPIRAGERNTQAKLSQAQVDSIRAMLKNGAHHSAIAKMFNVSKSNISLIRQGKTWPIQNP